MSDDYAEGHPADKTYQRQKKLTALPLFPHNILALFWATPFLQKGTELKKL